MVRLVGAVVVALVALAAGLAVLVDAAAHDTTLVSRADGAGGAKQNQDAQDPVISADGHWVAFVSSATNLHPDDTDTVADVFVRNVDTNTTTLVSRATGAPGAKGNGPSGGPSISADGRYVAFHSGATNLDPAASDAQPDVFVRDLQTNTTTLVSRADGAGGASANQQSSFPSISADGQHVSFQSQASNLDPADTDTADDVFARDVAGAVTRLISRADGAAGAAGNGGSAYSSISGDGRYVAFQSTSSNLTAEEDEPDTDVFRRDTQTHDTELVSRESGLAGAPARGSSFGASISESGRFVAFESTAGNINPFDFFSDVPGFGGRDFTIDVFRRDMTAGSTDQMSMADGFFAFPDPEDGHSHDASISADGRHVVYFSHATTYVEGDTDTVEDVYARDVAGGTTTLVSRATGATGVKGNKFSRGPAVSGDGRRVVYHSGATNLSPADTDERWDIFIRRIPPGIPFLTGTDPASPANDNTPLVKGGGAAPGTTVELFTTGDCSGVPVITGTPAEFESPGLEVTVPDDSTTTFKARVFDADGQSRCSVNSVTYREETSTPRPVFTTTNPLSPADNNDPFIRGTAAPGATVRLYRTADCTGAVAAEGPAADFGTPGLKPHVNDNTTTTFHATAQLPAQPVSPCSTSERQYVEDSTTPAPPQLTATDPYSPASHLTPRIQGTSERLATIRLYTDAACTDPPAATGSVNEFAVQGLPHTVGSGSTTTYHATATDAAGHTSACSTDSITYVHDPTLPAAGRAFQVNTSGDLTNDGCTPEHCTLREAIEASNADPQRNLITFVKSPRPQQMAPYGPLPVITDAVTIDGESASRGGADGIPDVNIDLSRGPGGSYKTIPQEDHQRYNIETLFSPPPPPRAVRYDGLVIDDAPGTIVSGVSVIGTDGNGFVVRESPRTVIRRSATVFEPVFYTINAPPNPPGSVQIIQPNLHDGIKVVQSPNTLIGGRRTLDRNVLTYNVGNGVSVDGQSPGTTIEGNLIGVAPDPPYGNPRGITGNRSSGVLVGPGAGADVAIGEPGGPRNVIANNIRAGVELYGGDISVEDNWIGFDNEPGRFAYNRNEFGVITSGAAGNRVGTPAGGNVISGNRTAGVAVMQQTRTARDTRIQNNEIGPLPAGAGNLGNGIGVSISRTDDVLVGGTGANEANEIYGNKGDGVQVEDSRVEVTGTSTLDNAGQGIDVLPNGPQVNDLNDAAAPQNRPVIEVATTNAGTNTTIVSGHVPTAPGRSVRVEVFGQPACDLTGVGEGLELLGTDTEVAGGNGEADFEITTTLVNEGLNVAATATSAAMGTSEHSPCKVVEQVPEPDRRTVNTTDDLDDTVCDATHCSLREAIDDANAAAGTDIIEFAIPPLDAAVPTINVTSALPHVTGATVIDGGTQRDNTPAGTPDVEINGVNAGGGVVGLHVDGLGAGNTRIFDLIVNRFTGDGIRFDNADGSRASGVWVGLDKSGAAAGNGGDGIELFAARDIGVAASVVSGNTGNGIAARTGGSPAFRTSERLTLEASKVGTNAAGTAARPNGQIGVALTPSAAGSIIGGASPELGNVVSGNTGAGMTLAGTGIKIQNNRVGTTADGMSDLGNGGKGIDLQFADTAVIGGGDGLGNLVSGNGDDGIGGARVAEISHNRVGTDVGGGAAIPNGGDGIDVVPPARIEDNLVSGNLGDGMNLRYDTNFLFQPTTIVRNTVGRAEGNQAALPNAQNGIELDENFNLAFGIGDVLADNVIASNGAIGLRDQSASARFLGSGNSFFDNGGLGIDRGEPGVTPNDSEDRVGPTNHVTLASARRTDNSITISGTLATAASPTSDGGDPDVDIEFFSSPSCDPSGRGEGRTPIGSVTVSTVDSGDVSFDVTLPVVVSGGHVITAMTSGTFPYGGISEFSRCRVVPDVAVPDVSVEDTEIDEGDAGTRNGSLLVRLSRTTTVPVTVDYAVVADTATPGVDVVERADRLTIPPGATSAPIPITVFGDTDPEADELAVVDISRASGGQLGESRGVVRIRDDDGALDLLEAGANDAEVDEGDSGTTTVNVPIRLTRTNLDPVSVRWETVPLEALAPGDFTAASGEAEFAPGETEVLVPIEVKGDTADEGTERFFLSLSTPDGLAITQPTGTVTIADDDAPDPPPPPPPDPDPDPTPTPAPVQSQSQSTPTPTPPAPPRPTPPRPPTPAAPGVAAQNGCLNGPITGVVARMAQVSETDLCVEGPSDLARLGCLRRTAVTHRFGVTLKTVRRTRKGRVSVPRRRSLVTIVRFTLNGKPAGVARRRPFVASIRGTTLKPGLNTLKAAVRLRDPLRRGKVFRNRSLTFRFRSCA